MRGSTLERTNDDDETTGPKPLRVIPLDRKLFPDAEIEGEAKKPGSKPKPVPEHLLVAPQLAHRAKGDQLAVRLFSESIAGSHLQVRRQVIPALGAGADLQ